MQILRNFFFYIQWFCLLFLYAIQRVWHIFCTLIGIDCPVAGGISSNVLLFRCKCYGTHLIPVTMSKLMARIGRFILETNDALRMRRHSHVTSDLSVLADVPYVADGTPEHLLDIYRPKDASADLPVIVNIHGGGLFASYKTVNTWFNHEWARLGYTVVSLSYRRLPDTTMIHQVEDVMTALRFLRENRDTYRLNLDRCYLTGDSAGALLSLFALSIEASRPLQTAFGIAPAGITFRAAAFISIMLDTKRKGLLFFLGDVVCNTDDSGQPYLPYILNPSALLGNTQWDVDSSAQSGVKPLPPLYLVTSEEDMLQSDTLKLHRLLTGLGIKHRLLNFPKGVKNKLVHVFSVQYPLWSESRHVYAEIDNFFRSN